MILLWRYGIKTQGGIWLILSMVFVGLFVRALWPHSLVDSKDEVDSLLIKGISVQFSCSVVSNSLWPHESQHAGPPCPSPTHSGSRPSSQWCHPAMSSSVVPFYRRPLFFWIDIIQKVTQESIESWNILWKSANELYGQANKFQNTLLLFSP